MNRYLSTQLIAVPAIVLFAWIALPGPQASAQETNEAEIVQQRDDSSSPNNAPDVGESEEKPLTRDQAKDLVAKAIESLYRDIVASDRPTRLKAVQSLNPEEKHIACLFGKKYGKLGFEVIKPRIDAMTARVDDVSRQLSRDGRFLRCELEAMEIPTNVERRALASLMQDTCPGTFRFKASIHTEKARASSGSYFVIDREVVLIRDGELIQIARRINTNR